MTTEKKRRSNFRLSPASREMLERFSGLSGIPMTSIVERVLEKFGAEVIRGEAENMRRRADEILRSVKGPRSHGHAGPGEEKDIGNEIDKLVKRSREN